MSVSDQSESVNEINVEGEGVHFAPRKSSLMEVLEENGSSILFGCKTAACGTCRITVKQNPENLSPIEEEERDFLEFLDARSDERLACQAIVLGNDTIEPSQN